MKSSNRSGLQIPVDFSHAFKGTPAESPEQESADHWRFQVEELKNREYLTHRFKIITPKKVLSMVLQSDAHTTWVAEHLINSGPGPVCK